jgi:hypothetical protein
MKKNFLYTGLAYCFLLVAGNRLQIPIFMNNVFLFGSSLVMLVIVYRGMADANLNKNKRLDTPLEISPVGNVVMEMKGMGRIIRTIVREHSGGFHLPAVALCWQSSLLSFQDGRRLVQFVLFGESYR